MDDRKPLHSGSDNPADRIERAKEAMEFGKRLREIVPCLQCGKRGKWTRIGYASCRAYTETGKLCDPCYADIMEKRHSRGWYVWPRRYA